MTRLDAARADGYAVVDQEVELGLRSIAVPLLTARGVTVAALNIGLPVRGDKIGEIVDRYLPSLLSVQSELRNVLAIILGPEHALCRQHAYAGYGQMQ